MSLWEEHKELHKHKQLQEVELEVTHRDHKVKVTINHMMQIFHHNSYQINNRKLHLKEEYTLHIKKEVSNLSKTVDKHMMSLKRDY